LGWDSFKYRNYDYAIGRFMSIDPLAEGYVYNGTYNFAENSVVANAELEGLEAKLAIYGDGGVGTAYTSNDKNSFHARASTLEKNNGYSAEMVSNGQALISSLKTATADEGSVQSAVIYAHGGYKGVFLNASDGFYNNGVSQNGLNSATIDNLKSAVTEGTVKFHQNATVVFGVCNTNNEGGGIPFAENFTKETGVTTIGATGYVGPEVIDGKETGRLTTDGTFIKTEKKFTTTFSDSEGNIVFSVTLNSQNEVDNFGKGFNHDNMYIQKTTSKIIKTDLGNTINPTEY